MNNTLNEKIDIRINIVEIIWDLFEQWKAVLIVALATMMMIVGFKYSNDINSYNAAQAAKEAERQKNASAKEQIAEILEPLPESDRSTVMTVIRQKEWIDSEKEYINKSILMNTDPTNQRTLVAEYYISSDEERDSVISSLRYAYTSCLLDKTTAEALGEVIDPSADYNYITELISVENSESSGLVENADTIMKVMVVLPEGPTVEKVEELLTSLLTDQTADLSNKICPHSIKLLSANEAYLYNSIEVKNRTDILYSIFNLQNNLKNIQTSLSDEQKAAIEAITAVKNAEKDSPNEIASDSDNVEKPGISKKYMLLGFLLGVMMYAFIYLIVVIVRRRIANAKDAEYYSQSRLLGEVYSKVRHKGIKSLLHSTFIDKFRYKDKLNEEEQIRKLVSALDVACKHAGTDSVALISSLELSATGNKIVEAINDKGIKTTVVEITKEKDDNYLLNLKDAVFIADSNCRIEDALDYTNKMNEYDIVRTGSFFLKRI